MKNYVLILAVLLTSATAYSQQYYMNGRFSNTTPDLSLGIDSAAFNFTNTTYTYYINNNPNPSSFGTYQVLVGGPQDLLILSEDSLGVCSSNGSGTTVTLGLDYTTMPFHSIIVSETAASQDSCPTHSAKMSGQFISTGGMIIPTASVKGTSATSSLQAFAYNGQLYVSGRNNEKVAVTVTNISGQKLIPTQDVILFNGQPVVFGLSGLSPGLYVVFLQSATERKAVKIGL